MIDVVSLGIHDIAIPPETLHKSLAGLEMTSRFSDAQIDAMYSMAYELYVQAKYEKAGGIFATLSIYRPLDARILEATALCYMALADDVRAIHLFVRTLQLRPEKLSTAFSLVDCLLRQGSKAEALEVLHSTALLAVEMADTVSLSRAHGLIELLSATLQ